MSARYASIIGTATRQIANNMIVHRPRQMPFSHCCPSYRQKTARCKQLAPATLVRPKLVGVPQCLLLFWHQELEQALLTATRCLGLTLVN